MERIWTWSRTRKIRAGSRGEQWCNGDNWGSNDRLVTGGEGGLPKQTNDDDGSGDK